jgi:hypothetical protein
MWPFKRTKHVEFHPDIPGMIAACKAKDPELYAKLGPTLTIKEFWRAWKAVHPEDFPQGGKSRVEAASIILDNDLALESKP